MRSRVMPFGRVGLCMCAAYIYMYICGQKNWLFVVLLLENLSLVQYTARLSSLTTTKGAYYAW